MNNRWRYKTCPGAYRGGRAGSGRIGCQQERSPLRQSFHACSADSSTRRLKVILKERTSETLCKPMGDKNLCCKTGSSAVWTRSPLFSRLLTNGPTLFCLCKTFSWKKCPGTCPVQKPDIPQAGRVQAHGGVAERGPAGLSAN